MKKTLLMILICLLYMGMLGATTIYEDAEDGDTTGWRVYDHTPKGAKIYNRYDHQKKSRVIKLKGKGLKNGYILGNWENKKGAWNNQTEKVVSWSMRFKRRFVVYIRVMTSQGAKYIYYTNSDRDYGVSSSGRYIHLGLGSDSNNGRWQTFTRDLEADLKKYQPNNALLAVNAFLIRGNGRVDDIKLSKGLEISAVHTEEIKQKSATIFWDLNEYATGQVEYGESTDYGSFSTKEESFDYNHHEQLLSNLKLDTTYHYRVISEDRAGHRVVSGDYSFKTLRDETTPPPYRPEPLPEDMLKDEAMSMNPDHPKFGSWTVPELIVDGHLELNGQYENSYYLLPNGTGEAHHKYTLVWDMETVGEEQDRPATVRIGLFGYLQWGFQNRVLNKKETLYAVVVSADDLSNRHHTIQMSRRDDLNNTTIKISNIRLYDGVIELPKPTFKERNFNGYIGMDSKGVFRRDGKVIFPITLYKDNTMLTKGERSVDQYLDQGITGAVMEAVSEYWGDATEDRVSSIVNNGMSSISIPITSYLRNPDYTIDSVHFAQFKRAVAKLKAQPEIWREIGVLSIDNEFYHKNSQFKESIAEIRRLIPDKPIQMLNGVEGISSWYDEYVDITGTYIANDHKADDIDIQEATSNIHQLESQKLTPSLNHPATLLQVNQGSNMNFGSIVMAGVAIGGTKLEYWKDSLTIRHGFRDLNMLEDPMWDQLPVIRKYLDKMCDLGIVETTPYIGMKIEQTNDTYEYIKARYGKEQRVYIIASNMTPMSAERSITFDQSYKGLHYTPTGKLKDIITGEVKGEIDPDTKKVKITLAPHQWVILEVERESKVYTYEDAEDGSVDRWWSRNGSIHNVVDVTRDSRVIELDGDGVEDLYKIGNYPNRRNAWDNSDAKNIQWSMKYSENFTVYVLVTTKNGGVRYLYYRPEEGMRQAPSGNILHGLGVDAKNGEWQTFNRNLNDDLHDFEPDNEILSVEGILIRGSGRIDDITMMVQDPTTPPVVDENLQVVTIEKRESGIEVTSIKDSDREMLNTAIDLFALSLQDLGDEVNRTVTASSGWGEIKIDTQGSSKTIILSKPTDGNLPDTLKATISISVEENSSKWDLSVDGIGEDYSLVAVEFPNFNIKASVGEDKFLLPYHFGKLVDDPANDIDYRGFNAFYPRGWGATMQFLAYYNREYGLYFGFHDPKASLKNFIVHNENAGIKVGCRLSVPNEMVADNSWSMSGDFQLQSFRGDWYDASQKYKDWVYSKAEYRPIDTPQRVARQAKMGSIAVWATEQLLGYTIAQVEQHVRAFKEYMDVPVGIHWNEWYNKPQDVDFPEYFPEKDGLGGVISRLKTTYGDDLLISSYINGRLYDTTLDSYQERGFPFATTHDIAGEVIHSQRFWHTESNGTRVRRTFAVMCPTQQPWQKRIVDTTKEMTTRLNMDGVYIDQVTAAAPVKCMNPAHGHKIGGGSYWRDGYRDMFKSIHNSLSTEKFIYSEGANDFLIDQVDGFLVEPYLTSNQIPAFQAVYSGKVQFIGPMTGASSYKADDKPDAQRFYGRLAQSFSFGVQSGRFYMGIARNQNERSARAGSYLRKLARLRYKLRDFFSFGTMKKPLKLKGDIPTMMFLASSTADKNMGEIIIPAIQTSAWSDGTSILITFVNGKVPTQPNESIAFSFDFDAKAYGLDGDIKIKEVTETTDGEYEAISSKFTKDITLGSYETKLFVVTPQ